MINDLTTFGFKPAEALNVHCQGESKTVKENPGDYTVSTCELYLRIKASQLNHCAAPTRCYWTRHVSPFIGLLQPDHPAALCHECFLCGTESSFSPCPSPPSLRPSLCLSLPANPPGRRAPPIQGSWGRICGAQPWSCLFTTRLNRPVWTAVRGRLPLCGHISAAICSHPSI